MTVPIAATPPTLVAISYAWQSKPVSPDSLGSGHSDVYWFEGAKRLEPHQLHDPHTDFNKKFFQLLLSQGRGAIEATVTMYWSDTLAFTCPLPALVHEQRITNLGELVDVVVAMKPDRLDSVVWTTALQRLTDTVIDATVQSSLLQV